MEELTVLHTGPLGVNTYILPLSENTVLIVDPAACAFSNDERKITDWLDLHHKQPAGIVCTHGHFDHITGLPVLKRAYPQCKAAIHADETRALGNSAVSFQSQALAAVGLGEISSALEYMPAAGATFTGGETLNSVFMTGPDENTGSALSAWRIIHTPGHSKGSVCLYNASEKTLISGDTLFYHGYGRTDLGGNEHDLIRSLNILRELNPPDTLVYPGHDSYGFPFSDAF